LLIADVDVHRGSLVEVDRRLTITRLGEDVDASRRLAEAARHRVEAVVSEYATAAAAGGVERSLAFATSAVRDATNGPEFLDEIEQRFGFATRLFDGEEEARLTFLGATAGHDLEEPTLVVDLGGGSTELAVGSNSGIDFRVSLDIGCVRLTERFLHADPPSPGEVDELRSAVRELLAGRVPETVTATHAIGVAGTVTTLATLHLGLAEEDPELVHGHVLPARWLAAEAIALARTPIADLLERRGLVAGRAPVIAAGALALAEVLTFFQVDELEVSERDILHGVALELAS
jgi:exopolyphosphatase/guanosine-5'-triphosphate,3'-diphosphate pyrophosphatase